MPVTDFKNVVLTRDTSGNATWGSRLESLGYHVYSLPTIKTVPLKLTDTQKDAIKHLTDFDWLLFTSANSARYFIGVLFQLGIKWPTEEPAVAAIGAQTAHYLEERGIRVTFQPTRANSTALGNELTPIEGARILLPQTDIASTDLARQLKGRGGEVTSLPIYTTQLIEKPDETFLQKLKAATISFLVFASPSSVQGFSARVTDLTLLREAKSIPAIAIGSSTATALENDGYLDIYTSRTPTIDGIITVLQQLISQ